MKLKNQLLQNDLNEKIVMIEFELKQFLHSQYILSSMGSHGDQKEKAVSCSREDI